MVLSLPQVGVGEGGGEPEPPGEGEEARAGEGGEQGGDTQQDDAPGTEAMKLADVDEQPGQREERDRSWDDHPEE
jgi:hypothetical protein